MAMNKVLGAYEPDNLFAANQELPAVADVLEIAASQDLKRGSLVNVSGAQIGSVTGGKKATGSFKFDSNDLVGDIIRVGSVERSWTDEDPDPEANTKQIRIGSTLAESVNNFIAELVAGGEVTGTFNENEGVLYVSAVTEGIAGNTIEMSENSGIITKSGATLTGGEDGSIDTDVYAVLAEDCDTTEGAKEAAVYLTGEFNIDAVKVNENVDDMAAVKIAARKVGIFLKKNI